MMLPRHSVLPRCGALQSSMLSSQQSPRVRSWCRATGGCARGGATTCCSQAPGPTTPSRRVLFAAALCWPVAAARASSPFNDVLPEVGVISGHLRSCPSTFNCVSTAARSSDQYAGPWLAPEKTPASAAASAIIAVTSLFPLSELVTSEPLAVGHYLRFRVPGKYEVPDELEFLIRPTGVSGRNWEGDAQGGLLTTFRSVAGTVKYVYPFMTPVTDGGLQKKRLDSIRERLAWNLVGCELVECYSQ